MNGWDRGPGFTPWGFSPTAIPVGPSIIFPLDPHDEEAGVSQRAQLNVRLADDEDVELNSLRVDVNGTIWVVGGVAQNGAAIESSANDYNGYDVVLTPPASYPLGSRQEVTVSVLDNDSNATSLTYHFVVGFGCRLVHVVNPFEGVLRAYFNRAMRIDSAFLSPKNWTITPLSVGAAPLEVTAVYATLGQPDVAQLHYMGGGSTYELSVISVVSLEGDPLEESTAQFEIMFGDEEIPQVRFFNSIYGPLGISQRVRTRRSMDDHVAGRSIAFALDEQLRLRLQQLDGTAGRDGRPGKRRT